jgi:hypothetical protein
MAKYDNITVQLTGKDGNAFGIIASVQKALKNNGVPAEEISKYRNVGGLRQPPLRHDGLGHRSVTASALRESI